ncbi:MAG: hypothetical protein EBU49_11635 [Proteobacteria bacterium]|nr:hypothetical protein [Pseudomonadota bacterium]
MNNKQLRLVLAAATMGWALDAFDFTLFLFAIPQLNAQFSFGTGFAGFILTCTLVCSAFGGLLFGVLADKLGRAKMLSATILIYSAASLGSATAQNEWQLSRINAIRVGNWIHCLGTFVPLCPATFWLEVSVCFWCPSCTRNILDPCEN